jgi:hypothetical protein
MHEALVLKMVIIIILKKLKKKCLCWKYMYCAEYHGHANILTIVLTK